METEPKKMQLYLAGQDRKCMCCKSIIPAGSTYYGYRERALSNHEALHAGTMYPKRYLCFLCAEKRKQAPTEGR